MPPAIAIDSALSPIGVVFDRWAKKVLSDELLCHRCTRNRTGRYEADLGGGPCQKRIALPGKGKSGSTRMLVAKEHDIFSRGLQPQKMFTNVAVQTLPLLLRWKRKHDSIGVRLRDALNCDLRRSRRQGNSFLAFTCTHLHPPTIFVVDYSMTTDCLQLDNRK